MANFVPEEEEGRLPKAVGPVPNFRPDEAATPAVPAIPAIPATEDQPTVPATPAVPAVPARKAHAPAHPADKLKPPEKKK